MKKLNFVNKETGLTLRQHNRQYGLNMYNGLGHLVLDKDYSHEHIKGFMRDDGAIGFCREDKNLGWEEWPIHYLNRNEWEVSLT